MIRNVSAGSVSTSNTTARNVVTPAPPTPFGDVSVNAMLGVVRLIDSGGRNGCSTWRITRAQTGQNGP